jgi:uncharacterized protein YkwD
MSPSMSGRCMLRAALIALALVASPAAAGPAEDQVFALVNAARAKAGCAALQWDARLTAAATGHARAMAQQNFFGHTSKNGAGLRQRVNAQGYRYRSAAENISAGRRTAAEAMQNWLKSPGHRKNLLNCRYSQTGIAMVYQPDDAPLPGQKYPMKYYWVQVLAQP